MVNVVPGDLELLRCSIAADGLATRRVDGAHRVARGVEVLVWDSERLDSRDQLGCLGCKVALGGGRSGRLRLHAGVNKRDVGFLRNACIATREHARFDGRGRRRSARRGYENGRATGGYDRDGEQERYQRSAGD